MTRLQLIGGGKMGEALLGGILRSGWCEPADVVVVEAVPSRRSELKRDHPGLVTSDVVGAAEGTILAVKPADTAAVARLAAAAGSRSLLLPGRPAPACWAWRARPRRLRRRPPPVAPA